MIQRGYVIDLVSSPLMQEVQKVIANHPQGNNSNQNHSYLLFK
jgi:hypothetical protein